MNNKSLSLVTAILITVYFVYAKLTPQTLAMSSKSEPIVEMIDQANQKVQMTANIQSEDLTCNCKIQDAILNQLSFDNPIECGKKGLDRNYLEPQLSSFKKSDVAGSYYKKRNFVSSNDVPLKCLLYTMKEFYNYAERNRKEEEERIGSPLAELFGYCSSEKGTPISKFAKPCLTEDYVYPIYNAFLDVTNCFGMDQKFFIPKILVESGFHLNAKGPNGDAGIGQFTSPAIAEANKIIDSMSNKIMNDKSLACQNLANYLKDNPNTLGKAGKKLSDLPQDRCAFLTSPPNPIRSLIYYAAFQKRQKDSVAESLNSLEPLMKKAGISDTTKFPRNIINDDLFILSYNAGPNGATVKFSNWLKFRINKHPKIKISKEDFNFANDIPDKYKDLDPKTAEKEPLTLPQYLKVYGKNYVRSVYFQKEKIDRNLGESVCTQNTFLQL